MCLCAEIRAGALHPIAGPKLRSEGIGQTAPGRLGVQGGYGMLYAVNLLRVMRDGESPGTVHRSHWSVRKVANQFQCPGPADVSAPSIYPGAALAFIGFSAECWGPAACQPGARLADRQKGCARCTRSCTTVVQRPRFSHTQVRVALYRKECWPEGSRIERFLNQHEDGKVRIAVWNRHHYVAFDEECLQTRLVSIEICVMGQVSTKCNICNKWVDPQHFTSLAHSRKWPQHLHFNNVQATSFVCDLAM